MGRWVAMYIGDPGTRSSPPIEGILRALFMRENGEERPWPLLA
jgi:hypothetical protein